MTVTDAASQGQNPVHMTLKTLPARQACCSSLHCENKGRGRGRERERENVTKAIKIFMGVSAGKEKKKKKRLLIQMRVST